MKERPANCIIGAIGCLFHSPRYFSSPGSFLISNRIDLIAACAFGLEAVVRRELKELGIDSTIESAGRVHFEGDWETLAKANLWLRTADRVLIQVARFRAPDFGVLFETTESIPWGNWISADAQFPVTGRSIKSKLQSVPAIQRSVKRAVVNAISRDHGTSELPETGAVHKIDVGLLDDEATLTIDTTGRSLHARGYRTDISRAPLKETLAAALVLLSYWKNGRPLVDPFCGSGTIPIEAALIGRRIAPGIARSFAMEDWRGFDRQILADLRSDARTNELPALETRLSGSDLDGRILRAARDNAARATVDGNIHFEQADAADLTSRKRFGCLITNPPYGRRIGAATADPSAEPQKPLQRPHSPELDQLYSQLPDVFRKLPTWSHYVLTAYPQFQRLVGRDADRRRKLYNGRIECTYYQFHGPKPVVEPRPSTEHKTAEPETAGEDPPARPHPTTPPTAALVHAQGDAAFGQLSEKSKHQAELFAARLKKRARHLRRWPTRRDITCFRLYEKDVPEIPLVVDRYEGHLHITEYARPHDRDPAEHANWLDLMARTAGQVLQVPAAQIHLKTRHRQRGNRQHEKVAQTNRKIQVNEGGLKFWVNLDDYVDTGLFLDHRETRSMVRDECMDKRFLNLFCYTGAFTVYAADGRAASTTSVDLSKKYLDWAEDNMRLNQFDGKQHQFVAQDVGQFLDRHPPGIAYDVVVLDPPTYSNSKRTDQDWNVGTDAVPMINRVLPLVIPGGVIYFSTNFRGFKFDHADVEASTVHEISRQTVPEDYRNQRIHRCWRIIR